MGKEGMSYQWSTRFLGLAEHVARWSKDPSTQCGAVIVRPDKTIASMGFNGFPRGIKDDDRLECREKKYERVIHAEMNALLFLKEPAKGYDMFIWPMLPCNRCAAHIIQAGIARIVAPVVVPPHWTAAAEISRELFLEAGVRVELY